MREKMINKELNFVLDVLNRLGEFDGQKITKENRVELMNFLKEITTGTEFERVDKDNKVIIKIKGMPEQLEEVLEISNINGKYYVQSDRLWKTAENLTEQLSEMKAMRAEAYID